jgi:hypothetical protein
MGQRLNLSKSFCFRITRELVPLGVARSDKRKRSGNAAGRSFTGFRVRYLKSLTCRPSINSITPSESIA